MNFAEMRDLFPSIHNGIHLNHAGASPISLPVRDAVREMGEILLSGEVMRAFGTTATRQTALREAFGRMLSVSPETLGFVRNTSHGLAITAQGIAFQPGENVVVASNEYPANIYPWLAQGYRGVEVKQVALGKNGLIAEADLEAACDSTTRVLAVSWVQWGTGQRMDLARLGAFCDKRGILLVVDVVQGLGALRIDLAALNVAIATAGSHKWLLAPAGLGILYVRPDVLHAMLPTNVGWNSVEDGLDWERSHFDQLRQDARRFEEGTPSVLATVALAAAVGVIESVGFDTVHDRVLALADTTRDALRAHGMTVISPEGAEQKSGIVAFRHPHLSHDAVLAALTAAKVSAAVRCGNVRFSPHAYQTEADIAEGVGRIPA